MRVKCRHCRRVPAKRKTATTASDGSVLVSCACGLSWVRQPKKDWFEHATQIVKDPR
jgi:hypothetical protein